MCLSLAVQATIVFQLFSNTLCQFPMQFPFPQMGPPHLPMGQPNMAHMGAMPSLAPQPIFQAPMPMNFPIRRKVPSVVMPNHYTRSGSRPTKKYRKKRRKPKRFHESWDTDTESESGSGELDFRRSGKKRRQVLTPVVSYITKDGYVVYQKKIKKDKAKEWLEMNKKQKDSQEFTSAEEKQFQKMLHHKRSKLKDVN